MSKDIKRMTVTMEVEGNEGLVLTLEYTNTTLDTVVMVQKQMLKGFLEILEGQDV